MANTIEHEQIVYFSTLTGLSYSVSLGFLQRHNGDTNAAIDAFFYQIADQEAIPLLLVPPQNHDNGVDDPQGTDVSTNVEAAVEVSGQSELASSASNVPDETDEGQDVKRAAVEGVDNQQSFKSSEVSTKAEARVEVSGQSGKVSSSSVPDETDEGKDKKHAAVEGVDDPQSFKSSGKSGKVLFASNVPHETEEGKDMKHAAVEGVAVQQSFKSSDVSTKAEARTEVPGQSEKASLASNVPKGTNEEKDRKRSAVEDSEEVDVDLRRVLKKTDVDGAEGKCRSFRTRED